MSKENNFCQSLPSESFPPSVRIKKRSQFLLIQDAGKKIPFSFKPPKENPEAAIKKSTDCFLLISAPSDERFFPVSSSRIGITVTKKVHKRAVVRNKLKRRIREIFRKELHKFKRKRDLVVICRKGASELEFKKLEKEVLVLLKRVNMYV